MLHWVKSFSAIALLAALFTLAPPTAALAMLMVCVFAALAALSAIVGALGRRADGTYSSERAIGILALAAAMLWAGHAWISNGWTVADARRAVDSSLAQMAQSAGRALP